MGKSVGLRSFDRKRISLERRYFPPVALKAKPMVLELGSAPWLSERPKRMNVTLARTAPVTKFDAELEGCLCRTHECRFVEAQHVVKLSDVRQRRFADPDDSDFFGFDEGDTIKIAWQPISKTRSCHPSGCPTAEDYDTELAV